MKSIFIVLINIILALSFLSGPAEGSASNFKVKPLYTLSNFSGPVPYNLVRLTVDRERGEVFVLDPKDGDIRIFNGNGMEVFRTEPYRDLGSPVDLAIEKDGSINLLVMKEGRYFVYRCDYRGRPVSQVVLSGISDDFPYMSPDRIFINGGLMYLVDMGSLLVTVFDDARRYVRGYRIADILELDEKNVGESSMFGFTVDREGNLLFTIPTLFSAFRVSPDGKAARFGEAGSSPGKFSVVSGIAVNSDGFIYLTDRNRSVVMIYSPELKFRHEFGYRGSGPGNLIVPGDLALDGAGRLYVAQMKKRGVQVYRVSVADGSGTEQEIEK